MFVAKPTVLQSLTLTWIRVGDCRTLTETDGDCIQSQSESVRVSQCRTLPYVKRPRLPTPGVGHLPGSLPTVAAVRANGCRKTKNCE